RNLDHVEVLGNDALFEDLTRLLLDRRREIARRQVREGEQRHARLPCQLGRFARGRVTGLACAVALLLRERAVVDEQLRPLRDGGRGRARLGVAGEDELPAGAGLAHHLPWLDDPAAGLNWLAALQAAERRARG